MVNVREKMKKKILINALHAEEKRVAIVEGDLLVDFYVEASGREHLRGNVYKATVARIEPCRQPLDSWARKAGLSADEGDQTRVFPEEG
jgi:hypothetical protein